jgi:hypothetical protein
MIRLGVTSGALFLIAACGGADKTAEEPMSPAGGDMQPCGDSQACAAPTSGGTAPDSGHDWSAWQSWEKLSAEPFPSEHGSAAFVDVYVSPDHVDAFTSLEGDMPQGMAIVKAAYGDAGGAPGELEALTVMAKMEPGYDPEHGDWYYGVLDPSGATAMQQGKLQMCIGCHEGAGTDYVFGETGN